jgi:hypothetical protein
MTMFADEPPLGVPPETLLANLFGVPFPDNEIPPLPNGCEFAADEVIETWLPSLLGSSSDFFHPSSTNEMLRSIDGCRVHVEDSRVAGRSGGPALKQVQR